RRRRSVVDGRIARARRSLSITRPWAGSGGSSQVIRTPTAGRTPGPRTKASRSTRAATSRSSGLSANRARRGPCLWARSRRTSSAEGRGPCARMAASSRAARLRRKSASGCPDAASRVVCNSAFVTCGRVAVVIPPDLQRVCFVATGGSPVARWPSDRRAARRYGKGSEQSRQQAGVPPRGRGGRPAGGRRTGLHLPVPPPGRGAAQPALDAAVADARGHLGLLAVEVAQAHDHPPGVAVLPQHNSLAARQERGEADHGLGRRRPEVHAGAAELEPELVATEPLS